MEVSGKLHPPAALFSVMKAPVHRGLIGVLDSSEEGNLWSLPEVEERFVSYPARSVVNTLTTLSPFLI